MSDGVLGKIGLLGNGKRLESYKQSEAIEVGSTNSNSTPTKNVKFMTAVEFSKQKQIESFIPQIAEVEMERTWNELWASTQSPAMIQIDAKYSVQGFDPQETTQLVFAYLMRSYEQLGFKPKLIFKQRGGSVIEVMLRIPYDTAAGKNTKAELDRYLAERTEIIKE